MYLCVLWATGECSRRDVRGRGVTEQHWGHRADQSRAISVERGGGEMMNAER